MMKPAIKTGRKDSKLNVRYQQMSTDHPLSQTHLTETQ